ncbi:MAG: ABC transporter permease [Bdellovibrionales bacterium]
MNRNLAAAKVAILSQIEYRLNFLVDAVGQPLLTSVVEAIMWTAIVSSLPGQMLGGFGREYYLSYALLANFVGRITQNWMFEFKMMEDIDTGRINSLLVRPISFYEFFLAQFMGYKLTVAAVSMAVPLIACRIFGGEIHFDRLPLVALLVLLFLVFAHTLSFCVACLAFFLNRAYSFTGIKNMAIWVLAGELIPLDLYPEPLKSWLLHLPFAAGVYIPVGYLTGRFESPLILSSFGSVLIGTILAGLLGSWLWQKGLRAYTGTGA